MTRKLNLMNEELLIKQMVDAMIQASPRHLDPLFTPPQDKTKKVLRKLEYTKIDRLLKQ